MPTIAAKDESIANIKDASRTLRDDAQGVATDLKSVANSAGKSLRSFVDSASKELATASDTVATQIRNKPVQSSAIALGIGFVLGALFRR